MSRIEKAFFIGFLIAAVIAACIFYFQNFTISDYWKAFWAGFCTLLAINTLAAIVQQLKKWWNRLSKLETWLDDAVDRLTDAEIEIRKFQKKNKAQSGGEGLKV